ncbi:MAG: alpha/beta hydrolase [Desulfobacter sp.]|nr:MAG: alpha/beta hydrolase [Desulfobacter sp.]
MVFIYLLLSIMFAYAVSQFPRNPVEDPPDWGKITDITIPAVDGGFIEVWRIDPPETPKGIIVFAHGWGRNRDRMVGRARIFAKWGFSTVIHSARDHGNSSPKRMMNAVRFAEDIETVINWVGEPVSLYGHSAGSAGAIMAAANHAEKIKLLFLEASYARTQKALLSLYRWANKLFGYLFGPTILFWLNIYYKGKLDHYSPARIAQNINMPVMMIHGEKDRRFPLDFAKELKNSFKHDAVSLYIAKDAGHSNSSQAPGYEAAIKLFIDQYYF